MPYSTGRRLTHPLETLRTPFAPTAGLPFANVRSAERVENAWREAVYTPLLTLGAFRAPVRSPDGSCRAAVARVLAGLVAPGQTPCTPKTDPYGKARQRRPEALRPQVVR
jgi:hypothetical protein